MKEIELSCIETMEKTDMSKKGMLLFVDRELDGKKLVDVMPTHQITIGCYVIYLYKKFNWFHRLMIRLLLGLKVEKVDDK